MRFRYWTLCVLCSTLSYIVSAQHAQHDDTIVSKGELMSIKDISEITVFGHTPWSTSAQCFEMTERIRPHYLKAVTAFNLLEGLNYINGVSVLTTTSVCQSNEVSINGLSVPYSLIAQDDMPIMGSLAATYALSSLNVNLLKELQVTRGAVGVKYGNEAIGGMINMLTKSVDKAPCFAAELIGSTYNEWTANVATKWTIRPQLGTWLNVSAQYNHSDRDLNDDGFIDQPHVSNIGLFNKWEWKRKNDLTTVFSVNGLYEDRAGGQLGFTKSHMGSENLYGEYIGTRRYDVKALHPFQFAQQSSVLKLGHSGHWQESAHGAHHHITQQYITFAQLDIHSDWLGLEWDYGLSSRYQYYISEEMEHEGHHSHGPNDSLFTNQLIDHFIPGAYAQTHKSLNNGLDVQLGLRYDYVQQHGSIWTPRVDFKWHSPKAKTNIRFNFGRGYRIVALMLDEHALLSGSRSVVVKEALNPETAWSSQLHFKHNLLNSDVHELVAEMALFNTFFTNKTIVDYDTNPSEITVSNLNGRSITRGLNMDVSYRLHKRFNAKLGATWIDIQQKHNQQIIQPYFQEKFSANWLFAWQINKWDAQINYAGYLKGPMKLPLISAHDPRSPESPWYAIHNLAFIKKHKRWEFEMGLKNLFNWLPWQKQPFLIARSHDPFNKDVVYNNQGSIVATTNNPMALRFDDEYAFSTNQGRRGYFRIAFLLP